MKTFNLKNGSAEKRSNSNSVNAKAISEQSRGRMRELIDSQQLMAKYKEGQANDSYEQEADQVADSIVSGSHIISPISRLSSVGISKKSHFSDRATVNSLNTNQVEKNGRGLNTTEKSYFEDRFGRHFDDVNIHDDQQAVHAAESINARAFTMGNNIYLNQGEYVFSSDSGKRLLAHELTHTIQQRGSTDYIQRDPKDTPKTDADSVRFTKNYLYNKVQDQLKKGDTQNVWVTMMMYTGADLELIQKAILDYYISIGQDVPMDLFLATMPVETEDDAIKRPEKAPESTVAMPNLDFLDIKFKFGNNTLELKFPAELKMHFHFPIKSSMYINLNLSAGVTGDFSVNVSSDIADNIGISWNTRLSLADEQLQTGLSIYSQTKKQHFHGEERQRAELEKRGAAIKDAIDALAKDRDEDGVLPNDFHTDEWIGKLGYAIYDLHTYVEEITPGTEKPETVKQWDLRLYTIIPFGNDDQKHRALEPSVNAGFSWYF